MKLISIFLVMPFLLLGQTLSETVEQLFVQKKYEQAQILLSKKNSQDPTNLEAKELLADAYAYQRKWNKATPIYKKLTEIDPSNANYWYKYGGVMGLKALEVNKLRAFFMLDDIKDALMQAANLDPNHIEARWALVEYYIQLPGLVGGSREKALKFANQLEKISPVDGYLAKGYVYEYNNEPQLAETYYKKAVQVGASFTCYSKLASFYEKRNPKKAIETIEQASKKLNRNALNYHLGKVSATYNVDLAKGEMCLKKYITNYSLEDGVPLEWAYFNLARIYRHQKLKHQAQNWINKALKARPDNPKFIEEKKQILKM
jgi:tetratricopeptide (TPR) repeat protein